MQLTFMLRLFARADALAGNIANVQPQFIDVDATSANQPLDQLGITASVDRLFAAMQAAGRVCGVIVVVVSDRAVRAAQVCTGGSRRGVGGANRSDCVFAGLQRLAWLVKMLEGDAMRGFSSAARRTRADARSVLGASHWRRTCVTVLWKKNCGGGFPPSLVVTFPQMGL